jgi:hypothetical protein
MATQAQMDRLLGKALFDSDFRALLLKDPEKAVRTLRYKLTEPQLEHIRRLDGQAMDEYAIRFAEDVDWHPRSGHFTIW